MNLKKLKVVRLSRGFTLVQVSQKTGYTASYLSQLERGLKQPSLEALRKIAECLSVPLITFLIEDNLELQPTENNPDTNSMCIIIHKNSRKEIMVPEIFTKCEFITPTLTNPQNSSTIIGYLIQLNPGYWASERMISHSSDESIYVLKGKMKACVRDDIYFLEEGDSLYIKANASHNFQNCGKEVLEVISYMSVTY